ncbi:MAG: dolichyl-phosphate beta-glucosyltransferase [Terriglobales bacterium]
MPSATDAAAPELSIVIPAYNEAARLPQTLAAVEQYLAAAHESAEILVVNDGSRDGTAAAARAFPSAFALRVLDNPGNCGKGYSVRQGVLAARGRFILFTDADLSAPIAELAKLRAALDQGADIAIGSRAQAELIQAHQSRFRETAGRLFNRMVVLTLGLPFRDTQCGFKLFRREAAAGIFPLQRIAGWGFDPELLFLAHLQGWVVREVPVRWSHAAGAKIRLARDSVRMFTDLARIRYHAARGDYRPAAARRSAVA